MQRKKSINIDIHNQITADDSKKECCGFWETMCIQLRKIIGKNLRAAETKSASSVLRTNRNASTVVESFNERKTGKMQKKV
jgi:hypothetical protein